MRHAPADGAQPFRVLPIPRATSSHREKNLSSRSAARDLLQTPFRFFVAASFSRTFAIAVAFAVDPVLVAVILPALTQEGSAAKHRSSTSASPRSRHPTPCHSERREESAFYNRNARSLAKTPHETDRLSSGHSFSRAKKSPRVALSSTSRESRRTSDAVRAPDPPPPTNP